MTDPNQYAISEHFPSIEKEDSDVLFEMTKNSTHPLSIALHKSMGFQTAIQLTDFQEIKGEGIEATFQNQTYRLGNTKFTNQQNEGANSVVYLTKNGSLLQQFEFTAKFREQLPALLQKLNNYSIHVLSGDTENDKERLIAFGFKAENLFFHQKKNHRFLHIYL